jgi:hypothetical protein
MIKKRERAVFLGNRLKVCNVICSICVLSTEEERCLFSESL